MTSIIDAYLSQMSDRHLVEVVEVRDLLLDLRLLAAELEAEQLSRTFG